ncbi:hypothetical protein WJX79_001057 [Trebouxia sp. C0005]
MYRYQTGALSTEGQRWFESQLYLSARDEQEWAGFDIDSVCQQVGCSSRTYSASHGQLPRASSHHSAAPGRAQQSPGDWSSNHRLPSCLAAGRNDRSRALAAASRSACRPDLAASGSQPARNSLQSSILEPHWLSPSSSRILPHQHRLQEQYVKQDSELVTSLVPSLAAGAHCNYYTDDAHQAEVTLLEPQLQLQPLPYCLPLSTPSATGCLSASPHASFQEASRSCAPSLQCHPAILTQEQRSEAAALSVAWPISHPSPPHLSGDMLSVSNDRQTAGRSNLCPEHVPEVCRSPVPSPTPSPVSSSPNTDSMWKQASVSEEDSGSEQPSKATGRRKTKIDHITVQYLRDHHCFDMPLAEAAKSLDVGLSVMKRVCRTLGLARWPYRTRASLQSVIEKTEKYLADRRLDSEEGEACSGQKAHLLKALQLEMNSVTGQDGSDLRSDIKKYRQSIFKLNYKIKKSKTNCKARHKIAVPQNAADRVLAHQALDPCAEAA